MHEFESGVFANTPAWHGLGVVFNEEQQGRKLKMVEALEIGELDWDVELVPVEYNEIETGFNLVVRETDDSVLGCVGPQYQPIQNVEAFTMLDELIDGEELLIETAISLQNGKRVCVVARRPDEILVAGEKHIPYIVCALAHDGTGAAKFLTTPTRVVCMNTFRVALATAKSTYSVRHTSGAQARLAEARTALDISYEYTQEFAVMGEELVNLKITDREMDKFLKELVVDPEEEDRKRAQHNAELKRAAIKDVYNSAENLNNIRGTRWGALNAVVEYTDHVKTYKSADVKMTAIMDRQGTLDQRAMNLLLAK